MPGWPPRGATAKRGVHVGEVTQRGADEIDDVVCRTFGLDPVRERRETRDAARGSLLARILGESGRGAHEGDRGFIVVVEGEDPLEAGGVILHRGHDPS